MTTVININNKSFVNEKTNEHKNIVLDKIEDLREDIALNEPQAQPAPLVPNKSANSNLSGDAIFFSACVFSMYSTSKLVNGDIRARTVLLGYFATCFATAFFIYVVVNMMMVLGLLPIVGSPLPIMSYGGSSMMAIMLALGIVMSCKVYKDTPVN